MRLNLARLKEMKPDMTISQLIYDIEKKNNEKEVIDHTINREIIDKYTGKYLKRRKTSSVFGESLFVYKIDEIKFIGYDISESKLYGITGSLIHFGDQDLNKSEIGDEIKCDLSYDELEKCEIIEYIDYNFYISQYNQITNTLKNIMNG